MVSRVPKADQWAKTISKKNLTQIDIYNILRVALGGTRKRPCLTETHANSISTLAEYVIGTADGLARDQVINERAKFIGRLIGYALLQVAEVVESSQNSAAENAGSSNW